MIEVGRYTADEDLLEAVRAGGDGTRRILVPTRREIVLGRSSKVELELNEAAVLRDAIPVLRRRGGGCTVLLDPGNVIVSVVLPIPGFGAIDTWFARISQWITGGLEAAGLPGVVQRGTSDLCLEERKIGGSCIYRARGLLYYSTTLLVSPDFDAIERYLAHPPREPKYRAGREHRSFLASLDTIEPGLTPGALADRLDQTLHIDIGLLASYN